MTLDEFVAIALQVAKDTGAKFPPPNYLMFRTEDISKEIQKACVHYSMTGEGLDVILERTSILLSTVMYFAQHGDSTIGVPSLLNPSGKTNT